MKVNINPAIFKAYDIRGIYPRDLDKDAALAIGQAFAVFLGQVSKKPSDKLNIMVGCDTRLSGIALKKQLVRGLTKMGAQVADLGFVTTPMFYFAVADRHYDGGVMITSSHNPKEYNGFKMVRENATPISETSGLREIQRLAGSVLEESRKKGKVIKTAIIKDYIAFNLKEVDKNDLKGLKIVIDTANAVPGKIIPQMFKSLPCRIIHLFKKIDGNFPNHSPDPSSLDNLKALREAVLAKKADLGVAFDGDGDRIVFVDEQGDHVSGNFVAALMAQLILKQHPGVKILYDVRSSNIIKETIESGGGRAYLGRIGHSFIKEKMKQENILFASELSGHYYHQDHYFCEAPFFVLFSILKELKNAPFSQLIKPFQKYCHSGEINFEIADKQMAMDRLEKYYASGKLLKIDGLRADFQDWWFLARPSNTEPLLRLVIEAKTQDLLNKKKEELSALLVS